MIELEPHILAIAGLAAALLGLGLVVWGLSALSADRTDGRGDSFLAPTLAVDALDPDLRVLYMRTLVLDARCAASTRLDDTSRCRHLARELRRAIVAKQAVRHARDEPVDFADLVEILDHAVASLTGAEEGDAIDDHQWDEWIEKIASRDPRPV